MNAQIIPLNCFTVNIIEKLRQMSNFSYKKRVSRAFFLFQKKILLHIISQGIVSLFSATLFSILEPILLDKHYEEITTNNPRVDYHML